MAHTNTNEKNEKYKYVQWSCHYVLHNFLYCLPACHFCFIMFNMFPLCVVATLSLLVQYTLSQGPNSADSPTPTDYPGTESPYLVIPTGTDIPPGASGSVAAQNKVGTYLYSYDGCSKIPGAKDKINGAYYDSWVIANTPGVKSDIDWNNAAALEYLGASGLNTDAQPKIQAVFANMATMIYSYTNPFQHYIKV